MTTTRYKYLTVSKIDEDWGLYVNSAGHSDITPWSPYPPAHLLVDFRTDWCQGRVIDEYQIVYISRGEGLYESAYSKRVKVEAGTVFFLFPGVRHRYMPAVDVGWHEYWVAIKGEYIKRLAEKGFISPERDVVHIGQNGELVETTLIWSYKKQKRSLRNDWIRTWMYAS